MKQHTIGARILAAVLPVIYAVGVALPAAADIPPALVNAALASTKAGSYHVEMTQTIGEHTMTSVGDVQTLSPMKMRMTSNTGGPAGQMQMVIVAPNSYVKTGNAPWKKYAGDANDFSQMSVAAMIAKDKNNYDVTDLGMQVKGGQSLHAFKVLNKTRNSTQTIYLDSAGRFARLEIGTMVMQFSNYGEPLDIAAPM